jgi:hypothetical protein
MECLTFRRTKLAAPHRMSPELAEHARDCFPCAAFAQEIDAFEQRLIHAARVDLPDGLTERIILRHQRHTLPRRAYASIRLALVAAAARRRGPLLAYAALVTLALVVTLTVAVVDGTRHPQGRYALADRMIAHVVAEPGVLSARDNVALVEFELAFARYGAQVQGPVGEIQHLAECVIDGVIGQHMVVHTPYGTASLLLIPERVGAGIPPRTAGGYTAIVVPLRGGSLGIVADSPEKAFKVERLIEARVVHQG